MRLKNNEMQVFIQKPLKHYSEWQVWLRVKSSTDKRHTWILLKWFYGKTAEIRARLFARSVKLIKREARDGK